MRTNNADNRWSALITSAQVQHLGARFCFVDVKMSQEKPKQMKEKNVAKSSLVLNESAIYNDRIFRNLE